MATTATPGRQWRAVHRFARISPRKARLVINLIRGLPCAKAVDVLRFDRHRSTHYIRRVLHSAMSNADEAEADMGSLYVSEARIDGGPYYKRWQPKDRGRAHPIAKRTSHIVVQVTERHLGGES